MGNDLAPSPDHAALLQWGRSVIPAVENIEIIARTSYSYVLKLSAQRGIYYLKQTPISLFREADILNILRLNCNSVNVPKVVAANKDLRCFIIDACGEETLWHHFLRQGVSKDHLLTGISHYIYLQKASSSHLDQFRALGVPDWSLAHLQRFIKI